jgi:uncharacterized protein YdhG (YjbR/CyaY superfamily)
MKLQKHVTCDNPLKKLTANASKASTPQEYIAALPDDRKEAISELRKVILKNIPEGFSEVMNYGMLGYVVPHSLYPDGYQCNPKLPLPFMNIASQKNFIAIYHMGVYANKKLLDWFVNEYPKHSTAKLDMGKSCIRFKKPEHIPYKLIGKLASKITVKEWIDIYEKAFKK